MIACEKDWFGERLPFLVKASFEVEGEEIVFRYQAHKAPHCDESLIKGQFAAGLWENDVAEFFLGGPGDAYQEFNVSPTGAWWSAVFSSYREQVREVEFAPEIEVEKSSQSWAVSFRCSVADCVAWNGVSPEDRTACLTSILFAPQPLYLTWPAAPEGEPDFHLSALRTGELAVLT